MSINNKKCIILVDGSNFYFKLKDLKLSYLLTFNFSKFIIDLANDYEIVDSIYFIGKIRTDGSKKSNLMLSNQQKLLKHLSKNGLHYKLGYLLKYKNDVYHEKGVDVNIATHILIATYEDLADKIVVISSDTDLVPAISKAREKGKIVEYIGFKHNPSRRLMHECNKFRLLSKDDLVEYTKKSHKQQ